MIPQIIYIVLMSMGLGMSIILHGKPRNPHDLWTTLISAGIGSGLLYWGGFFDKLLGK